MKTLRTNIVKAQIWIGDHPRQAAFLGALFIILTIGVCLSTVVLRGRSAPTPTPTKTTVEERETVIESVIESVTVYIPTPTPFLEIVENTDVSNTDVLGRVEVEYPLRMSPGSSDFVNVQIYVPQQFVSIAPVAIERVDIPPDVPPIIGKLGSHQATILVRDTMRVELSSLSFETTDLYPAVQPVNTRDTHKATIWAWTIQAPNTLGRQVLVASVYLGKDVAPNWTGSITVEVVEFTPTPPAIQTPIPPLTGVRDQLTDNSAKVLIAVLIALIGLIVPMYKAYQDNQKKNDIQELEAQMEKISQENNEYASVQATSAILEKDVSERKHLTELRQILATDFDKDELRVLCFDLGVDYEDLSDKKSSMAMELVARLEHLGRIPELVKAIRQRRPDISWSHAPKVTEKVPPILQGAPPERLQKYKELEKEINRLKSVKWWQFWR